MSEKRSRSMGRIVIALQVSTGQSPDAPGFALQVLREPPEFAKAADAEAWIKACGQTGRTYHVVRLVSAGRVLEVVSRSLELVAEPTAGASSVSATETEESK